MMVLVPRLMGNEPGSSSADVSLEQLPSGRWVAWGGSAVAAGATRAEALSFVHLREPSTPRNSA